MKISPYPSIRHICRHGYLISIYLFFKEINSPITRSIAPQHEDIIKEPNFHKKQIAVEPKGLLHVPCTLYQCYNVPNTVTTPDVPPTQN